MKVDSSKIKFLSLIFLTVVSSLLAGLFSAPLLRVFRKTYGPRPFWMAGLLVFLLFGFTNVWLWGAATASMWIVIGIYGELEEKGFGWWNSSLLSIFAGSSLMGMIAASIYKSPDMLAKLKLKEIFENVIAQLKVANPNFELDANILLLQLPSILMIMLILSLAMSLILEGSAFSVLGLPKNKIATQLKTLEFKLPDYFVWLAMTGFLFSFLDLKLKFLSVIGLNIVNVASILYFFQGLAILEVSFRALRMGKFSKILLYFVLVSQAFLFVSILGFIDYWIGFRGRIREFFIRRSKNNPR